MQNEEQKAEQLTEAGMAQNPLLVAVPFVSGACEGEKCSVCRQDAKHKVGEVILFDDPHKMRHELTAYVCCEHFQMLFGKAAQDYCIRHSH